MGMECQAGTVVNQMRRRVRNTVNVVVGAGVLFFAFYARKDFVYQGEGARNPRTRHPHNPLIHASTWLPFL